MIVEYFFLVTFLSTCNWVSAKTNGNYRPFQIARGRNIGSDDYLYKYFRYPEIENFLKMTAANHNEISRLSVIGNTFENRSIYGMELSTDFSGKKPLAIIEAGIHAREWAAPALALHTITRLLGEDKQLLDEMDWIIVPCANPDGYEYSHSKSRMWRKNRQRISWRKCIGTDLNRNFGINWGKGEGTSHNSCTEIYEGTSAFSEYETQALRNLAVAHKGRISSYLCIHSYGPMISYPYAYKKQRPANEAALESCGNKAAHVIEEHGGVHFAVGNSGALLGMAPGGADDYMMEVLGVPFVYTVELPPGGTRGFDLPPAQIKSMVEQSYPGIKALATCWKE